MMGLLKIIYIFIFIFFKQKILEIKNPTSMNFMDSPKFGSI
jgi:hypothetical protein